MFFSVSGDFFEPLRELFLLVERFFEGVAVAISPISRR
jgi:hypothetical protein